MTQLTLALSAVDPRDMEYSVVTVAWIEDGTVPDQFQLGVDERGRVRQPWAWAAGLDGGDIVCAFV